MGWKATISVNALIGMHFLTDRDFNLQFVYNEFMLVFQDNTFTSYQEYYISYFEMRLKQTSVLGMLHYEMTRVRTMPGQAEILADYILDMKDHVVEMNIPTKQIDNLQSLILEMEGIALISVPGIKEEYEGKQSETIREWVKEEAYMFHSCSWWKRIIGKHQDIEFVSL